MTVGEVLILCAGVSMAFAALVALYGETVERWNREEREEKERWRATRARQDEKLALRRAEIRENENRRVIDGMLGRVEMFIQEGYFDGAQRYLDDQLRDFPLEEHRIVEMKKQVMTAEQDALERKAKQTERELEIMEEILRKDREGWGR